MMSDITKIKANIFEIQRNSFVDGPGIRTTVFFKGCNLRCKWCHNPESQAPGPQIMHYKTKCQGCGECKKICPNGLNDCKLCGKCIAACPSDARQICGKEYTVSEVFSEVVKDKLFYDTSNGGVTFSGGECMLQIDFLREILKKCKDVDIHTAVDTAGNLPWEYFESILSYTDLFLYDVKAFSERLHIEGTGVSNNRILSNLKRLSKECGAKIIIRIPVIPLFNANEEEMKNIAEFLSGIDCSDIELLPYHKMGSHKYEALDMQFTEYPLLGDDDIAAYKKIFQRKSRRIIDR